MGQLDSIKIAEDKIAHLKWSAELNEKSSYYAQSTLSCIIGEDSSILTMRQDDEYHEVEITVLDSNLKRKCSYNLDKKNKEFHKSKRVIGFIYKDKTPFLFSINLSENYDLTAIPVTSNCSVDNDKSIEINTDKFDKSSQDYIKFFKNVSKLKSTAFQQKSSLNGEYTMYFAHEYNKGLNTSLDHKIYLIVLNKNLELIHYSKNEIKEYHYEFLVESFIISNDGVAYVCFFSKGMPGVFSKKLESIRELFIGDHGTVTIVKLDHESKYIQSATILNDFENDVKIIYVLANESKYKEKMTSVEINSLDKLGEVKLLSELNASEFEIENNENYEKCNYQLFKPHSLLRLEDGSYFFILEEYDQLELKSTYYSLGYTKFYEDIFVCKLNSELKHMYNVYFEKGVNMGGAAMSNYGGSQVFLINNKVGILYNVLNEKRTKGYFSLFERNRYSLFLSITDGKEIESHLLFEPQIKGCNLKVFSFSKPSFNKYLFYGNNIVVYGSITDKTKYGLFQF